MNPVETEVRKWIEHVVIGLNLCPFAGNPYRDNLVRIVVSEAETERALLEELRAELQFIGQSSEADVETTVLVLPRMLADFESYNQFLDEVDVLLRRGGWDGTFQVASFHPHYRFEGTAPHDAENLTNRAPYPILHILRESSIDRAVANFPGVEEIPDRNIERMNGLTPEETQRYFPWLSPLE